MFVGGGPQGKKNSFLRNKKGKETLESLCSFSVFIFACCMVKELFVRLTVDNSWIVCSCLLPDSAGQAKEMAKVRLLSSAIVIDVFDSRNIQDRSLLKVYNKDPAHAFNHTPKTVNGDMRVSVPVLFLILFENQAIPFSGPVSCCSHTPPPGFRACPRSSCLMTHDLCLGKEIRFRGYLGQRDWNRAWHILIYL